MKLNTILMLGLAVCLVGCSENEAGSPDESGTTVPAEAAIDKPVVVTPADAEVATDWRDGALLAHMHRHAEHLAEINLALENDDLGAAMTPAYWLSRHETLGGIPAELQTHVTQMREAALAVENSEDLASARVAARQLVDACGECHSAVGVEFEQ